MRQKSKVREKIESKGEGNARAKKQARDKRERERVSKRLYYTLTQIQAI